MSVGKTDIDELEEICREGFDCNGDTFTYTTCEIKASEPPNILRPDTTPVDLGDYRFNCTKLLTDLEYDDRFRAIIRFKNPFKVNDIIQTTDNSVQYYIKKFMKRTPYNHFEYELKRADCSELVRVDFDNLVKGKVIVFKGYFRNNK